MFHWWTTKVNTFASANIFASSKLAAGPGSFGSLAPAPSESCGLVHHSVRQKAAKISNLGSFHTARISLGALRLLGPLRAMDGPQRSQTLEFPWRPATRVLPKSVLVKRKVKIINTLQYVGRSLGECGPNATNRAKRMLAGITLFAASDCPCRFSSGEGSCVGLAPQFTSN